jgi:hypothetical protein
MGSVAEFKFCEVFKAEAGKYVQSRVKWPTIWPKGENQEEHVHHLKTEAQPLIATLKAPTPEKILKILARLGPEGGGQHVWRPCL